MHKHSHVVLGYFCRKTFGKPANDSDNGRGLHRAHDDFIREQAALARAQQEHSVLDATLQRDMGKINAILLAHQARDTKRKVAIQIVAMPNRSRKTLVLMRRGYAYAGREKTLPKTCAMKTSILHAMQICKKL